MNHVSCVFVLQGPITRMSSGCRNHCALQELNLRHMTKWSITDFGHPLDMEKEDDMTLLSPNAGRVDPGSEAAAAAAVIAAAVTVTIFWMMTFPPVKDVEA